MSWWVSLLSVERHRYRLASAEEHVLILVRVVLLEGPPFSYNNHTHVHALRTQFTTRSHTTRTQQPPVNCALEPVGLPYHADSVLGMVKGWTSHCLFSPPNLMRSSAFMLIKPGSSRLQRLHMLQSRYSIS